MSKDQVIKILDDREHVLKRTSVYAGSTKVEKQNFWIIDGDNLVKKEIEYIPAQFKIFNEILDNSIDEVIRGFCTNIKVTVDCETGYYTVQDNGRGIPIVIHEESKIYTPEVVFCQLRAGSNFDDSDRLTVGMNGMGATLTTILSEKLIVEIRRDGKVYQQSFENNMSKIGAPNIQGSKDKTTGTKVKFKPDPKIFSKIIPIELIKKRCLELSYMYPEVTLELEINCEDMFNEDNTSYKFDGKKFQNFVEMFKCPYSIFEDKKSNIKMAILENKHTDSFEHFSNINGADTFRGGTHVDVLKELFCDDMKDKIKKEFKLEVTNTDVAKKLIIVNFQNWNAPQFEGQTKEKFVNDKVEVKKVYDDIFSSRRLTSMFAEVPSIKQAVVDEVMLKNEKKMLSEISKTQKTLDKKRIAKLIEASGKDRSKCSIYITEGDSAISNLATVRDSKTMAGLPLRGKVMNVLETSVKDVVDNKEIQSIMAAVGLKIGTSPLEIMGDKVCGSDLNYGKIIIATDQDMDGYSIRCLLINFLFKFWPEIIKNGYVYILETPLYEVIDKRTNVIEYFYNKEEYDKFMHGKHAAKYEISYFKGLGSCGKEAWDYMINKNPNMVKVAVSNVKQATEKLKMAFGDDAEVRKKWLLES